MDFWRPAYALLKDYGVQTSAEVLTILGVPSINTWIDQGLSYQDALKRINVWIRVQQEPEPEKAEQ